MSDQILRSKVIRLAHSNPELRPHLIPLLKQAALPGKGAPTPWKVGYSVVKADAKGTGSVYGTILKMTSAKLFKSLIQWEDGSKEVVETSASNIRAFRGKPPV
jgi:hypothetical protein